MPFNFHDPLAAGSHLLMAAAMVLPLALLLRLVRGHARAKRYSVAFYAVTVLCLYSASGLFHAIDHSPSREFWSSFRVWQRLDQTAIYWLIFGSNVPIMVYVLRRRTRKRMLWAMGLTATAGTAALWLLPRPPHTATVIVYLVMGAMGLIPLRQYYRKLGWSGLWRIALLAFLYLSGGASEAVCWPNPAPPWFTYHEVLHLFDMAGTLVHFELLVRIVAANREYDRHEDRDNQSSTSEVRVPYRPRIVC